MSSEQLYDTIGATCTVTRRTEPRIAAQLWAALGDARTVLNVGAGTGSCEPRDRDVLAVEPSATDADHARQSSTAGTACTARPAPTSPWSMKPGTVPSTLAAPSVTGSTGPWPTRTTRSHR